MEPPIAPSAPSVAPLASKAQDKPPLFGDVTVGPFSKLPGDAFGLVVGYLGPRTFVNLGACNKTLHGYITKTESLWKSLFVRSNLGYCPGDDVLCWRTAFIYQTLQKRNIRPLNDVYTCFPPKLDLLPKEAFVSVENTDFIFMAGAIYWVKEGKVCLKRLSTDEVSILQTEDNPSENLYRFTSTIFATYTGPSQGYPHSGLGPLKSQEPLRLDAGESLALWENNRVIFPKTSLAGHYELFNHFLVCHLEGDILSDQKREIHIWNLRADGTKISTLKTSYNSFLVGIQNGLCFVNVPKEGIDIYDLETGEKCKRIPFPKEFINETYEALHLQISSQYLLLIDQHKNLWIFSLENQTFSKIEDVGCYTDATKPKLDGYFVFFLDRKQDLIGLNLITGNKTLYTRSSFNEIDSFLVNGNAVMALAHDRQHLIPVASPREYSVLIYKRDNGLRIALHRIGNVVQHNPSVPNITPELRLNSHVLYLIKQGFVNFYDVGSGENLGCIMNERYFYGDGYVIEVDDKNKLEVFNLMAVLAKNALPEKESKGRITTAVKGSLWKALWG